MGVTETPDTNPENVAQIGDSLNYEAIDPDDLELRSFPITRRGFDPTEVRAQLQAAASEIRRLQRHCNELSGRLTESRQAARDGADARRVAEMLGVEVSSVLEAAHNAAVSRVERAESEAEAMNHEARAAAESVLADTAAQSAELIATARLEAEEIIEDSRNHGREMVNEAQTVRERMLRDLARKRQAGRTQIEQLRAGRDRLLDALATVQTSLDTAIEDLVTAVPEARAAANRAGLRIASEPIPTADDLEAEIEAGRLVGYPLVSDSQLPGPISDTFTTGEMEALDHLDALSSNTGEIDPGESDEPNELTQAATEHQADPAPAAVAETESDDLAGNAKDVFARLRSSQEAAESQFVSERDPDSSWSQTFEVEEGPESLSDTSADSNCAVRQHAANAAAKAMKRVLVEEQGALLDGIRRDGTTATFSFGEESHNTAYDKAVIPALREQCISLGGPSELDLTPALANIHLIALEPVRRRLADIAKQSDSEEELSDAVRALYREARSRHLNDAASAASVAVDGLVKIDKAKQDKANRTVRWVVDDDGSCGADCADNALAGEVIAGDQFPTGDQFPPAHPICTCRLVVGSREVVGM